jgi:hypothetical protein
MAGKPKTYRERQAAKRAALLKHKAGLAAAHRTVGGKTAAHRKKKAAELAAHRKKKADLIASVRKKKIDLLKKVRGVR